MKKGIKWTALLLAAMMLTGCAQKTEREAPQLLEPVGVQSDMAAAYIGDIYEINCYNASIKPYVEELSFAVSGEVMSVNGYPGKFVEEGEVLIELDQDDLRERAEQLQQELSYAQQDNEYSDAIAELDIQILQTELRQLMAQAEKEQETVPEESEILPEESEAPPEESEAPPEESEAPPEESEAPPEESEAPPEESEVPPEESETPPEQNGTALRENEIALKKNEIAQKQALLRQDRALRALELTNKRKELEEIRASLDDNVMHAPFSGRIIYGDMLSPGSWVNAEDPIVFLADDNRLTIVCEYISESAIQSADRIYAHIGAKEYELKYLPIDQEEYISLALSGAKVTTTFEIIASEEELAELEAGQYAAVCLVRDYVPDALLIPSGAVMKESAGKYVYVDEDGSRVKRMVKTGKATDGLVQIVEGLEEGEIVYVKD